MRTFALVAAIAAAIPSQASAQSAPWEKLKLSDQLQQLTIGGDLRLRMDARARRGANTVDRTQNRFRLRVAAEMKLPHDLAATARFASGTGEQTSTNQTYANMGSQKAIWIDQAYARWTPQFGSGSAHVASGRMQNLLWRVNSSDIVWDDDFNPEGFQQGVELLAGGVTLFANGLQMVAHEGSGSGKSAWLFSQQAGAEFRLPMESRLRVAGAYHKWSDEQRIALAPGVQQDGNRRTGTAAATSLHHNRFGVAEVTAQLSAWAGSLPLAFQGTLIRNMRARGDLDTTAACGAANTCPPARDGYQAGVVLGAAKAAGTWEAAYFRKYSQTDSTVADVADSDFGDGGTNRRGHIFWVAYNPKAWMTLKAKAYVTETIDKQFNPGDKAVNRLQLDWQIKF